MSATDIGCIGKMRFSSERAAKRAKRRPYFVAAGLHAYFCKNCGTWHIGNTIRGPRRAPYKRERVRAEME